MFWKDIPSSIDHLLTQEDVKLETILNEDGVLQECMENNANLLAFLTKEETITELISIIITEPLVTENVLEQYKLPNTVCEILTFNGNKFSTIIVEERYLCQLWSFLELKNDNQCLNPLLASFFSKLFLYILSQHTEQVLDFISSRQEPNDFVSVALRNISVSAIMDFVFKCWEYTNLYEKVSADKMESFNNYLTDRDFIAKLIETFKESDSESKQQNVAILISDMVRVGRELLARNSTNHVQQILHQIECPDTTRNLLSYMFESKTKHSIVSGLKLIQDLLVYRIQVQTLISKQEEHLSSMGNKVGQQPPQQPQTDGDLEEMPKYLKANNVSTLTEVKFMSPQLAAASAGPYGEHLARCIENVCTALNERLEDFVHLLVDCPGLVPIPTTVGLIRIPVGLVRLEVIHLFVALFATSHYTILEKCAQLHVLKVLTDLFFEYQLNNQLHKYYEQIIGYVFQNYTNFKNIYDKHNSRENLETNSDSGQDSDDDARNNFIRLYHISKILVKQILEECHLIEKIVENFSNEMIPVKSGNKEATDKTEVKVERDEPTKEETKSEEESGKQEEEKIEMKAEIEQPEEEKNEQVEKQEEQNEEKQQVEKEQKENQKEESQEVEENQKVEEHKEENKVKEEIEEENMESKSEDEKEPKECIEEKKSRPLRPSYLGHLRLIANILNDRCCFELLNECVFTTDTVLEQWHEFVKQKLSKLNQLVNSSLATDSIMVNSSKHAMDLFYLYQTETMSPNLPLNVELLPNDFGQNSLGDINDQLKLKNFLDLEENWNSEEGDKIYDLEKYFECASIFDDEDEEDEENPFGSDTKKTKKEKPYLITQALLDDFATFVTKESTLFSDDSSTDPFEDNFANFEAFNNNNGDTSGSGGNSNVLGEDNWPTVNNTESGNGPPPPAPAGNTSNNDDWAIWNNEESSTSTEPPEAGPASTDPANW